MRTRKNIHKRFKETREFRTKPSYKYKRSKSHKMKGGNALWRGARSAENITILDRLVNDDTSKMININGTNVRVTEHVGSRCHHPCHYFLRDAYTDAWRTWRRTNPGRHAVPSRSLTYGREYERNPGSSQRKREEADAATTWFEFKTGNALYVRRISETDYERIERERLDEIRALVLDFFRNRAWVTLPNMPQRRRSRSRSSSSGSNNSSGRRRLRRSSSSSTRHSAKNNHNKLKNLRNAQT